MKQLSTILLGILLCATPLLTSCSDSDDDGSNEFANWQTRNNQYFADIRTSALNAINQAKTAHPDSWQDNCDWRAYLSYARSATATNNTATDSIFVKILKRGTGTDSPLSTDNVRVFYLGRLMPTTQHPDGKIFDHSGQSSIEAKIFDRSTAVPATFKITELTRGFATALQYMHIGDRWRIYVPYQLGYGSTTSASVPAYSTLVFDIELVQYARMGTTLPDWN